MEEALADVHLIGTPSHEVAAAIALMKAMGEGGEADVLRLLVDLRTTLRSELLLEADFARYRFLRIETAGPLQRRTAPPPRPRMPTQLHA